MRPIPFRGGGSSGGNQRVKRFNDLFKQPEFHLLLCFLGIVLFNWPIIALFERDCLAAVFWGLFLIWALVILVMFFIGRSLSDDRSERGND
jgi:hypothetical protein